MSPADVEIDPSQTTMVDGSGMPNDRREDDMDIFSGALAGQLVTSRHCDEKRASQMTGCSGRHAALRVIGGLVILACLVGALSLRANGDGQSAVQVHAAGVQTAFLAGAPGP